MHLQAQEAAESRASSKAKLAVLQQHLHQKQSQLEATQADYLQAQVSEHHLNDRHTICKVLGKLIESLPCCMQVNTQALKQAASNAEDGGAGSRFARFDQACLELFQMGRAGKLPGAFFGRVCNIAQVVGMDSAAATNAVAKEAVNLVSCYWAYIVCPVSATYSAPMQCTHAHVSPHLPHCSLSFPGKAEYGVPRRVWCSDSLSSLSLYA